MRKLFLIALITIYTTANAQKDEYFTFTLAIDPTASVKEKSPNLVAEIELVSNWGYVKAGTQILPALEGGYIDFVGAMGFNGFLNRWKTQRIYTGGRFGTILRNGTGYPLAGFEAGIDFDISENVFIGIRGTGDYREDFKFSGAEPEIRYSGFVRVGFKF